MKFNLRPSKVLRNLFIIVSILLVGNLLSVYLNFNTDGMNSKVTRLIIKLFNFNLEANLPTYFSSLVLLGNGIILALIGRGHKKLGQKFWYWLGLSAIFVFLAFDEMIQIHEQLRAPMEAMFNTSGLLYFAWFIPYLAVTILIAIAYFKFMMRLPKKVLRLFIIAGILYVGGAVGMEMVGGWHAEIHGEKTVTYALMYSFEELLEMSGAVVFMYALLTYITMKFEFLQISWDNE
jgi:hypothetical protein